MDIQLQLYRYSLPFTSIFSFCLGSFVLYKNPKNLPNQTWFLTCLAVCSWSAFFCLSLFAPNFEKALLYSKICNVSAAYIPALLTHFCIVITNPVKHRTPLLKIAYLNCFIITVAAFSNHFLSVRPISIFPYFALPRFFFHFFAIYFFFYFFYQEYLLFKSLKHLSDQKRNQIKYIIAAITCGYLGGAMTFLPVYNIPVNPMPAHFVWVYAAIISYAIVKHGLMDITILIRKGLVYSLLISFITSLYFILVLLTGTWLNNIFGLRSWMSILLIFTIIAVCFKPLERKIQQITDRFIFKTTPEILEKENQRLMETVRKQDQMKAVATLAAGMAHEIKNPLAAIKTFTEYISENANNPEFIEKFKKVVGSEIEKINSIVQQVLEFSKPLPPHLEKLEIHKVLEETIGLLNGEFVKRKIRIEKQLLGPYISIDGDKKQIKQVFLNIFLNSMEAMPNGGSIYAGISQINVHHLPHENYNIQITISDTGLGISKENLSHIFDPFFTTKESGTGLGLSIAHGIIKEHKGKIDVSSKINEGTTFTIYLK